MQQLIIFLKFCVIIGLCTFSIKSAPKNNVKFTCTNISLVYSIFFIILISYLWSIFGYAAFSIILINIELFTSNINHITDAVFFIQLWLYYYMLIILSIKNRHKHANFLNCFNEFIDNFNDITKKSVKISIGTIMMITTFSIVYLTMSFIFFSSIPQTNFFVKIYPFLSVWHMSTFLIYEAYVKCLIIGQNRYQSFINQLLINMFAMEKIDLIKFQTISHANDELNRLSKLFCHVVKNNLGIVVMRHFSIVVVSCLGILLNFRNLNGFHIEIVFVYGARVFPIIFFMILVYELNKFGNQVIFLILRIY